MLRAIGIVFAYTCAGVIIGAIGTYPFVSARPSSPFKSPDADFIVATFVMMGGVGGGLLGFIVGLVRVISAYVAERREREQAPYPYGKFRR